MEENSRLFEGLIGPDEEPEQQYGGSDVVGAESDDGKIYMSVDDMLVKHVGEFGFAQLLHFVLVSLAWTVDALHTMVMIFGDRVPEWKCKPQLRPQLGSGGLNGTVTRMVLEPVCTAASSLCDLDPGTWEWVGKDTASTVSEWGLICAEEYKAGLAASLFFIGVLCGAGIYGSLSDSSLGRKGTVALSCLTTVFLGLLTSFSPSYWIYAALRFMTGLNCGSIGVCSFVLATEIVGPSKRGSVGMATFYFFTGGIMILPLFGYFSQTSWRMLYFTTAVPGIVYCVLVLPFLWESPRWYLVKGRSEDAMKVMRSVARWNGNELPARLHLRLDCDQQERDAQAERRVGTEKTTAIPNSTGDESICLNSEPQDHPQDHCSVSLGQDHDASKPEAQYEGTLTDIFRFSETRWRMLIMVCIWFFTGVCYYGISLNAVNLNFNLYISVFMNGLIEIPAFAGTAYLLSKMGRKSLLVSAMALSGVCCVCGSFVYIMEKADGLKGGFLLRGFAERIGGSSHTYLQLSDTDSNDEFDMGLLRLIWAVLGMLGMAGAFSLIYIYTAELFPTVVRNAALGLAVQAGGVGAVIAPFVVVAGHFSPSLPFVIFGFLALGGAALSTRLPETLNQRLHDTLEEMERDTRN
ncbi:unnamed protein product [Calypogeia fissa]